MTEDSGSDEAAIGQVLMTVAEAFRELDASGLEKVYADDADWMNAFGTTQHGRDAIVQYHEQLFDDPHFSQGEVVGEPEASIRSVSDDVAVAKTYVERKGQETQSGDELPRRHNHSHKVLARQDDGWVIVSEMYMDERQSQPLSEQ
ncbi:YybH family protein [Saliphagus infecundisoli]|uniref:YybH family protein n=1 Tax=Saliphagus infecundisoli TaxID=1849069 RepID=A0ABD5QE66_9EURY|nr:SgcJ/EcaC family oxidoreductase [Saliphagus infecundisoli]